uniref:hypothetical protein n=1 Tax=Mariniphaga sediminis TaxID=1628158 RepID=UPI0035627C09
MKKVKNVGAYIGKYMSKEHKNGADKTKLSVDGRLWFSSVSVSKMKNLQIEAFEPEFVEFIDMLSDAKNEKKIYETEYTTTLSIPVDTLYKQGFTEIPKRFFDYANDIFNGFRYSGFENEKEVEKRIKEKEKTEVEKPKSKPEQIKFDFMNDVDVMKIPVNFFRIN